MKVVYELDKEDVRKIICEKYEISEDKVVFHQPSDIAIRIDMTRTENPEILPERAEAVSEKSDAEQAAAEKQKAAEPEETADEEAFEIPFLKKLNIHTGMTDRDIPDDKLAEVIRAGIKISELVKAIHLDKKAKDRLYWRATRLRSECASRCDG